MSFARLPISDHIRPDNTRVAALSATIALNLALLLLVLRPMAPQLAEQLQQQLSQLQVRWIDPPAQVTPPPPVVLPVITPKPKVVSQPHVQPQTIVIPSTPTHEVSTMAVPDVAPTTGNPHPDAVVTPDTAPVEATLAYRAVPLKYPVAALHSRMEGTVLLKVLVDERGVPQDVIVLKGSGYALLDRSAREQVMQGWKFAPAMVDGHAVRAWAQVPVNFNINQF